MNLGIGKDKTREDHRNLADQLYASYARGRDLRRLVAIIGEAALSELDRQYLGFAAEFEAEYIGQGHVERSIDETLALGWRMLARFPRGELKRIRSEHLERYYDAAREAQVVPLPLPASGRGPGG
jgi:V/A-type H+-transporting ATPase subunit B